MIEEMVYIDKNDNIKHIDIDNLEWIPISDDILTTLNIIKLMGISVFNEYGNTGWILEELDSIIESEV